MSKIAEQKALEAYPDTTIFRLDIEDKNKPKREEYIKGYDKAIQDFEEFIYDKFNIHPHNCHVIQYDSNTPLESMDDFIKQIENYMQDEM